MTDKMVVKFQLNEDMSPVTIAHGHIRETYQIGKTYDCTPEEWDQIFKPTGMFEIGTSKKTVGAGTPRPSEKEDK